MNGSWVVWYLICFVSTLNLCNHAMLSLGTGSIFYRSMRFFETADSWTFFSFCTRARTQSRQRWSLGTLLAVHKSTAQTGVSEFVDSKTVSLPSRIQQQSHRRSNGRPLRPISARGGLRTDFRMDTSLTRIRILSLRMAGGSWQILVQTSLT